MDRLQCTDIQIQFRILLGNHVVRVDSIHLDIGSRNMIADQVAHEWQFMFYVARDVQFLHCSLLQFLDIVG